MLGTELGPYTLQKELGSGGTGRVCLAEAPAGRRRAIKIIHPHLLESPGFFNRFLREAEAGKRVDHSPDEHRKSTIENISLHRDIAGARKEHGSSP